MIRPTVYEGRPKNLYAFNDVAEAIVVHWLVDKSFSYDAIHNAIDYARRSHPTWALIRAPVGVASAVEGDRGVIAQRVAGEYVDIGGSGEQGVLRPEMFERASDMLRAGGWIANELGLSRIEVDPTKLGGAPSLRGHRWPVERVARIAADEPGRSILVTDYGLDDRDVEESLRWTEAAAALT